MPSYILRKIDPKLWEAFKKRAESEGRPLKFVILELLKEYAKHGYDVMIGELRNPPTPK